MHDSKSAAKNDEIHPKASQSDRFHEAIKEKLVIAPCPEKIHILTLAPDAWSRKYCAEYFNLSEYLVRIARKLKKVGGILAIPSPKRGKKFHKKQLILLTFIRMMNLVI